MARIGKEAFATYSSEGMVAYSSGITDDGTDGLLPTYLTTE